MLLKRNSSDNHKAFEFGEPDIKWNSIISPGNRRWGLIYKTNFNRNEVFDKLYGKRCNY